MSDFGSAPRANAAQLAQRQIKSVKGRRPGRSTPLQSPGIAQFGQSQGTAAPQFGGGMFGGGIQQPTGGSGFNFAVAGAPPAPTFHNPFQGSAAQSSGFSDNDERRDPNEERPNKRRSGGVADGDSVPLFAPQPAGPFGQSTLFGSSNGQQQNGGSFSFGQSNGFNSPAAANPFAQPASTPSINFGGASQDQPIGTPFKFGQPSPQVETASTPFKFGASATPAKPPNASFSFGQTSGQATSTGINFGSVLSTSAPATNLFGTSQPPSTNLFGSAPQQSAPGPFASLNAPAAPASNMFGGSREASPAPSAGTNNIFGKQEQGQKPTPPNGLFGQQSQQPTPSNPTSTLFGNLNQAPTPSTLFGQQSQQKTPSTTTSNLFGSSSQTTAAPTMFGEQKSQPASTLFGNLSQTPSTSNMFSKPAEPPTPSNNLFGGTPKPSTSSNDLFGNLNKPVDQAVTDPKPKNPSLFGSSGPQNQPSTLFGQAAPPTQGNVSASPAPQFTSTTPSKPLFSFAPTPAAPAVTAQPSNTTNLFSRSMEAPTANGPPPSGMFPSLQSSDVQDPSNNSSPLFNDTSEGQASNIATPRPIKKPSLTRKARHDGSDLSELKQARHITDETIAPFVPARFTEDERKDFHVAYRMRNLNKAMSAYFTDLKSVTDPTPAITLYTQERDFILDDYRVRIAKKRSFPHDSDPSEATPSKRAKQVDFSTIQSPAPKPRLAPSAQKQSLPASTSAAQTSNSLSNGNISAQSPAKASVLASSQSSTAPSRSMGKRKADNDLTSFNVEESAARPLRQIKTPKSHGSSDKPVEESAGGSNTSNIFKNILDSPSKPSPKSPTKKTTSLPSVKDTPSKPNPFGGLPVPKLATNDTPAKPNPFSALPVPKSPSKDSPAKVNPFGGLPVPKSPVKSAPSPSAVLFGAKPPGSTQFTSPSVNMFTAKSVNPSESEISAPPSSIFSESKPASSPANLFGSKLNSSANMFGAKPAESSGAGTPISSSSTMFGGKSTPASASMFGSKPANSTAPSSKGFSMPGFGAGSTVNFAAQFGQQAEKDLKDSEEKKMQKDMDEDYDSDDDKEEWIANWKEKRRVELENLSALTKTSKGGFSLAKPKDKVADAKSSNNTLFGLGVPTPSQSGLFSPANISRTSTPGAISSGTGSVFDGHTPGKLAPFSNNIFGHLSDSAKSDDADEESAGESDPEADGDSENKDPNYTPQQETGSGAGTPASETGAGIASAKKASMFSFTPSKTGSVLGQSTSGTTTPRGGLFDRITRDVSGNPVRAISTEEKENTQPNTATATPEIKNPFGSLNKSQTAPADQTWKIDSPIKFGSATPSNETKATPTFNVTAATPTKSSTPVGIFGNLSSGPTSAPFSNLFGNSGIAKPAPGVGFSFGGASNTTSLFPSATTSRATSPGATTDGDSAAEDPDAEKHEQINLTAGGPGEEDEEVIFETRAKALQFTNKEGAGSPWETRGVGPFRVLKHKETKASRMLLRAEPRGSIVFNKAILNFKYEHSLKTVKLMTAGEDGNGFETWVIQVKNEELARELAEVLEANKAA